MNSGARRSFLVVGGTSGIGRAAALQLGSAGNRVLVVGRDPARGADVVQRIGQAGGNAEFLRADLSSMQETQRLSEEVERRCDRLSGLVHSAAVIRFAKDLTSEGFEATFAVYTLARHLLTRRLLDLLHASGEGRIVIVGVVVSERFKLNLGELEHPREPFRFYRAIAQNQISTSLFAQHLATLLEQTPTNINVIDPGYADTGVTREGPAWIRLPYKAMARMFGSSVEDVAGATVALLSPEGPGRVNGYGFRVKHMGEPTRLDRPPADAKAVWELTERLLAESGYELSPVQPGSTSS